MDRQSKRIRQGRKRTRTRLGDKFSEGSRMLWLMIAERYNGAQHECAAALGLDRGQFSHVLYGDRRLGIDEAIRIRDSHGIDPSVWAKDPTEPFTVPTSEGDDQ